MIVLILNNPAEQCDEYAGYALVMRLSCTVSGHDSAEDAIACLHLMQWKVKEDLKGFSK